MGRFGAYFVAVVFAVPLFFFLFFLFFLTTSLAGIIYSLSLSDLFYWEKDGGWGLLFLGCDSC